MSRTSQRWIDTDRKVAFLRDPRAYAEPPSAVETIETHKSWVFLTDDHAYKLKKPIRYNSVDFRSLDARCEDCETEVRLNRRLAGQVYLGVVPITLDSGNTLKLDGSGPRVDCLVKMERLPADRMLSRLIIDRRLDSVDVKNVARKLARFYATSPSLPLDPEEYLAHLQGEIDLSLDALSRRELGRSARVERLRAGFAMFFERDRDLLEARAVAGRIVDGHGDLRAEHVCLLPEPVIFDCLEFDVRLRQVDPVDELSFLGLECKRLGDDSITRILINQYQDLTGDSVPDRLIAFYTVYRATMWARLAAWRTTELEPADWGKWLDRTDSYLQIAEAALPSMVETTG